MHILDMLNRSPAVPDRPSVCTVGTFDGVHLGHQQLIHAVVNDAHAHRAQSVVVTFYPHPRVVLGRAAPIYLTTSEEKAEQMHLLGIDVLNVVPFDRRVAEITAEDFVGWMCEAFDMVSLWIGPDFALGNQRRGNAGLLCELGRAQGFQVNVLPPVNVGSERISSTRIRASLARGDMRDVNLGLGRPFRIFAAPIDLRHVEVLPTQALPPPGRYAVWVCGALNEARLPDGPAPGVIELTAAVEGCDRLAIEFVE